MRPLTGGAIESVPLCGSWQQPRATLRLVATWHSMSSCESASLTGVIASPVTLGCPKLQWCCVGALSYLGVLQGCQAREHCTGRGQSWRPSLPCRLWRGSSSCSQPRLWQYHHRCALILQEGSLKQQPVSCGIWRYQTVSSCMGDCLMQCSTLSATTIPSMIQCNQRLCADYGIQLL